MTILLDTHVLLWALAGPQHLTERHRQLIIDPTNTVYATAVNIVESAIKTSIGKLRVAEERARDEWRGLLAAIHDTGFEMLPLAAEHAARSFAPRGAVPGGATGGRRVRRMTCRVADRGDGSQRGVQRGIRCGVQRGGTSFSFVFIRVRPRPVLLPRDRGGDRRV